MPDETDEPSILLTGSSESDDSNLLLFGGLAAVGIGLWWWSRKKKEEESEEGKTSKKRKENKELKAQSDQVVFASDFSGYEIGNQWFDTILDPYLEDMVENYTLATPEWKKKGPLGKMFTEESLLEIMDVSRKKVLSAFEIGHFVFVGDVQKTIAVLPDHETVRHFKGMLDAHAKQYQENY